MRAGSETEEAAVDLFDLSGKSYRGFASVVRIESDGIFLSLPRSLSMYHRRSSTRFRAGEEQPVIPAQHYCAAFTTR